MSVTWADFWNGEPTVYVSSRHMRVHYEKVVRDILKYVPGPEARLVDYGCGDTPCAKQLAAACGHLFLCDGAPTVRERLVARYAGCPNISVISPEEFAAIDPGTIDTIIVNSVIQYLSKAELAQLLSDSHDKLHGAGRLVLGDVVPRAVGPLRDAVELFRFAGANGFLLAAAAGLVRSSLSSYPRVRREYGFLRFDEPELTRELTLAGFVAERDWPNIGHNTARMTFVAAIGSDCSQPAENAHRPRAAGRADPNASVRAWVSACVRGGAVFAGFSTSGSNTS